MSTCRWRIDDWNPGKLPADFAGLFVKGKFLTSDDGESLMLAWEDSEAHRCSMTLPGNLKEGAFGAPVEVKREGFTGLNVSASIETSQEVTPRRLTGTLRLIEGGTPPGTFAATLDPGC